MGVGGGCYWSQYFDLFLGWDTANPSQHEDMQQLEEDEETGVQRMQILSEVASLLNEDSGTSSDTTLPYSPRDEDQL